MFEILAMDLETLCAILNSWWEKSTCHWWIPLTNGQWCRYLVFFLIWGAGDLRRHHAHIIPLQCAVVKFQPCYHFLRRCSEFLPEIHHDYRFDCQITWTEKIKKTVVPILSFCFCFLFGNHFQIDEVWCWSAVDFSYMIEDAWCFLNLFVLNKPSGALR